MFHKELWQYGQRRTGAAFLHSPMPGYHFRRYSKGVMPSDFLKTLMKYPAFWKPHLWAMDSTEPSLNRSMDLAWEMRLAVRSSDRVEPNVLRYSRERWNLLIKKRLESFSNVIFSP